MEKKKEIGFIEKFYAAGEELEKEIKDGGIMILIASEGRSLDGSLCYIKGNKTTAAILLANCAHQNKDLKRILERALIAAAMDEQMDNK